MTAYLTSILAVSLLIFNPDEASSDTKEQLHFGLGGVLGTISIV